MIITLKFIFGLFLCYFLGSIPTAYIFGKIYRGIDIREHGSKNVGATNVFRVLGKVPGAVVLSLDILKGLLAIVAVPALARIEGVVAYILFGVAAVCGHNWTIFLKFKGGKGVATSLGVLIGLTIQIASLRFVLLGVVLIWGVVFLASGYVSLASMVAVIFLPFLILIFTHSLALIILGIVFCLFVIVRHKPNIHRLLHREESRVKLPFHRR